MISHPIVSVVLPLYNSVNYIKESVESILNQQYTNFELIIIDDCSSDGSAEVVQSINDNRIRYIKNESNIGLNRSLNLGISLAKGKYIARMDHDDISLPNRFSVQVSFLEKNLNYILIGSNHNIINENGTVIFSSPLISYEDNELKSSLFFGCPFIHPGIMIRKSVLQNLTPFYNETIKQAEDYVLYCTIMNFGKFYTPKDIIFSYREHQSINRGTSPANKSLIIDGRIIAWNTILDKLKIQTNRDTLLLHDKFCYYINLINEVDVPMIKNYISLLYSIKKQNKFVFLFDRSSLEKQISIRSFFVGKFLIQNNRSIIPYGVMFYKTTTISNLIKLIVLSIFK